MSKKLGSLILLFIVWSIINTIFANDSLKITSSNRFSKIVGDTTNGSFRGHYIGDEIFKVQHAEKALLEGQGDDFLFYRVLCDTILTAEISYTFDRFRRLISIQVEFFEKQYADSNKTLTLEFHEYFTKWCGAAKTENSYLIWKGTNELFIEYKTVSLPLGINTEIELYKP